LFHLNLHNPKNDRIKIFNDHITIIKGCQMITGGQVRAARGFLKWSVPELAQKSGVSTPTIHRLEQIDGLAPTRMQTMLDLKRAFEEAGVEFLGSPDNGPGVRLKPQ
jgi:hypothetical protein